MLHVRLTLLVLVPTFACQNGGRDDDDSTATTGESDDTSTAPTEPATSESTAGETTFLTACESSDADSSSTAGPPAETTGTTPSETSSDPGSSSTDTSTTTDATETATDTTETTSTTDDGGSSGACPAGVLAVPGQVEGTNVGQLDELTGSCGPIGTADQAFVLTAPSTGDFVVTAEDATLYVLDATCDGTELGCAIGDAAGLAAIELALAQDASVTVVVDDTNGAFRIDAWSVTCPYGGELSNDELPKTITMPIDYGDQFGTSCSVQPTGADAEVVFTAPVAGTYVFDNQTRAGTTGPVPTTGLSVLAGTCGGDELGCTDPWAGPGYVITDLAAEQTVTVVLDALGDQGASLPGTGTVNVELAGPTTCPAAVIDEVPSTFSTQTFTATNDFDWCAGWQGSVDTEVVFTAPADGMYTFDTARSTIGTIIELRQGTCSTDAAEACIGYGGMTAFTYDMTAGQTITLNIESAYGAGHLTLDIDVLGGTCGDEALVGALPIVVSGTTEGADNTATACGRVSSPDTTYTFTAPQEGWYFFEVDGVDASPYVAVHTPTCQVGEIACGAPPDSEAASVAVASLVEDQDVVVIVDSNGAPGDYDLEVSRFECEQVGGPLPADFANPGGPDLVYPGGLGCGYGWGYTDTFYEFTAPGDGRYVFETYDELLMRFDGECGGSAIGCGTRSYNNFYLYTNARVTAELAQGEVATLMISNAYGAPLHAEQLTDTCPDAALVGALPIAMGGLDLADNDEVLSCALTGLGGESTLSFTAPAAGNYRFAMSGVGGYGAIGVLDGCGGTELACASNLHYYPYSASTTVALGAGQAVIVVAEGAGSVSAELLP